MRRQVFRKAATSLREGDAAPATAGAYVRYPFQDLLRLVALESRRNECAIVGEDLGTVPEGFRDTMRATNALSYRVVAFERRDDASFVPPREYPPLAAAALAATGADLCRRHDSARRAGHCGAAAGDA